MRRIPIRASLKLTEIALTNKAIPIAWEAGDGARLTVFVFVLAYGVLYGVGCCFGLVGVVPVMAVFLGGGVVGWLLYARPEDEVRTWPFFARHPLPFE